MGLNTSWKTFMKDLCNDKIFSLRILKKQFTPFEMEEKFCDEDVWEEFGECKLVTSIELPDKDILIGVVSVLTDYDNHTYNYSEYGIEYFKLSECRLVDITEKFKNEFFNGYKENKEE